MFYTFIFVLIKRPTHKVKNFDGSVKSETGLLQLESRFRVPLHLI